MIKFLFFMLFLFMAPSFAGERGNGGLGVICGKKVFVLDYYEALEKNKDLKLIKLKMKSTVANRLGEVSLKLKQEFLDEFIRIGAPADWSWGNPSETFDSYRFQYEFGKCKLVQLVQNRDGKVIKSSKYFPALKSEQLMVIRLHEVIYSIATKYYGHRSSDITRLLVIKLLEERFDLDGLSKLLEDFVNYEDVSNDFQPTLSKLFGSYILINMKENKNCPTKWAVDFAKKDVLVFAFVTESEKQRLINIVKYQNLDFDRISYSNMILQVGGVVNILDRQENLYNLTHIKLDRESQIVELLNIKGLDIDMLRTYYSLAKQSKNDFIKLNAFQAFIQKLGQNTKSCRYLRRTHNPEDISSLISE